MCKVIPASLALSLASLGLISCDTSHDEQQERTPSRVRVLPVIELEQGPSMKVYIGLDNASDKAFRYIPGHSEGSVHFLELSLFRETEHISPVVFNEPPEISKERIREIEPGKLIRHTVDIAQVYGDLKPGRYLLRVRYEVGPDSYLVTEYGMTSLSLDLDFAYIVVNE